MMCLSSITRPLTNELKSALMPTALRFFSNSTPLQYNVTFNKYQRDGGKQKFDFFKLDKLLELPSEHKAKREKYAEKYMEAKKQEESRKYQMDRGKQQTNFLRNNSKLGREKNGRPQTSAWEYPPQCCDNPCPDLLPRFDSVYYKPTDKAARQYQKTWVECLARRERPRKVHCYDKEQQLPPIYPRRMREIPTTARALDTSKMEAICSGGLNTNCPHIEAPCFARGRYPPTCRMSRTISNCIKKSCPYPSYSECMRRPVAPAKRKECNCVIAPAICEVVRYFKRKLKYDIPPPLPAWVI